MSSAATSPDQLSICSIMSRKVMIGSLQVSTIVQQTVLGCNVMMKHIFITMRIFAFDVHFREPSVERLPFYLPK